MELGLTIYFSTKYQGLVYMEETFSQTSMLICQYVFYLNLIQ